MPISFHVETGPSQGLLDEVAALDPENPYYTLAYARAMDASSRQVWVLAVRDGCCLLSACTAFLESGRMSRSLEIPSLPAPTGYEAVFWNGLFESCKSRGISNLEVNTYASIASPPATPVPTRRTDRIEYVIDLRQPDLWRPVRKGHRWSINRARKAGLEVRFTASEADCHTHCQMMAASMRRRRERGERVSTDIPAESLLVFLRSGAGTLSQVTVEGRVLSSAMILLSERGAYYQTAGTGPDGVELGASPFLVFETARALQERGLETFNLGGVSGTNPGLHDFKTGFGTAQRSLAAAEYDLRTNFRKALERRIRSLRSILTGLHEGKEAIA
jgi:hypothetical protein